MITNLNIVVDEEVSKKNEVEDCIVKVKNKWKIRGNKVKYWDADFDTKKDAQAALRAYWAGKHKK